jgi:HEAT repeat protein
MPDIREDQHPKLWSLLFGPEQKKRLEAVDLLAAIDVEWPVAWLSLLVADADPAVSRAAFQAIRGRGPQALPLLSVQRLSPLPKVRQSVARLYGEFGDLYDLHDVLPALFDPAVDVREEGRKSTEAILNRSLSRGDPRSETELPLEESMRLFAALAAVPQLNVRSVVVSCFLTLSVNRPQTFWELMPQIEQKARSAIEHELLTHPSPERIALLYHGLVASDSGIADRAVVLIERLLNKDTIGDHVESLARLAPSDRKTALKLLSAKGLVGSLFEYFPWIRRNLRLNFLQLFQDEIGEKYSKYLGDLLGEANPHLVPTLIDNFLTFGEALPQQRLKGLLENPSPVVQRAAIRYLHLRGRQNSVQHLIPLASSDDPQTARAAVKAVSRISRDYLIDHFASLSDDQRRKMTQTLARVDPNFVDGITEVLIGLDEEDRIHLTSILSELGDHSEAQKALGELMDDPSDRIRATAVRGLAQMDVSSHDSDQIDRLLADPDPRVRANAIECLPLAEKMKRRDRIELAARSESPRERANAVVALAAMGSEEYELALMKMLRHPDSWMRSSGLWALSQVDLPHLLFKALELCSDSEPHVRVHALRAIGKKGNREIARHLSPWLSDPYSQVREAAQKAIEKQMGLNYQV